MSNEERVYGSSGSHLNLYSKLKTISADKIPKSTESQAVIINFYSAASSQKTDKVVQTDFANPKNARKYPGIVKVSSLSSELSFNVPEGGNSNVLVKNSDISISDDITQIGLMEHRRHNDKHASANRTQNELERKKLEAELKAAEEIAKIRQMVIEKRLAVELAALNDGANLPRKPPPCGPSSPPSDLDSAEPPERKKTVMDTSLPQEMECPDVQTRFVSPRVFPPTSSRQTSPTISPKLSAMKTELLSSVLSSLRSLSLMDQKTNLDKKFYGSTGVVNPNTPAPPAYRSPPDPRYDPRERPVREQRNSSRERTIAEERYDGPPSRRGSRPILNRNFEHDSVYGLSEEIPMPAPSVWKSTMAKLKRKMKAKTPEKYSE